MRSHMQPFTNLKAAQVILLVYLVDCNGLEVEVVELWMGGRDCYGCGCYGHGCNGGGCNDDC